MSVEQPAGTQLPLDEDGTTTEGFVVVEPGSPVPSSTPEPHKKPPQRMLHQPNGCFVVRGSIFPTRKAAEEYAIKMRALSDPPRYDSDKDMSMDMKLDQSYPCAVCGTVASSAAKAAEHGCQHRPFDCTICNATYATHEELEQHWLREYPSRRCGVCFQAFHNEASLDAHSTIHKAVQCTHCGHEAENYVEMWAHKLSDHTCCKPCTKVVAAEPNSAEELKEHYRASHPYCAACAQPFTTPQAFQDHNGQLHHFSCSDCEHVSKSLEEQQQHDGSHAIWACNICPDRRFKSKQKLAAPLHAAHAPAAVQQPADMTPRVPQETQGLLAALAAERQAIAALLEAVVAERERAERAREQLALEGVAHERRMREYGNVLKIARLLAKRRKMIAEHKVAMRKIDDEVMERVEKLLPDGRDWAG